MNITITVRHTDINPQTRQYIEEKVSRLKKYFNNILHVDVIIDEEKFLQKVEILVKSPIFDITAIESAENVRAAFDKAFHVAEKSIRREKERISDAKKSLR
ncbi:MAG: hypothetical protein Kow0059_01860 [Candidatus Sumerlaeia bacterium]